ncbi:MAG: hypothetical protein H6766_01225 [Candidatus Peribacteria bacterium]|nr:MAG: hypothetical protein H6766_01225 [Candidatus Peribacteria bacterium]
MIQSVTSTGAVCVSMEDYWRLTDAQSPDGSIYYSQKVAVGMAASAGDFGDNAQFMVDGDLMPTGDMIVGTDARHVTVGKNDANTQLQIDVQGAPLVMGLEQHVGIGGTPNTTIDPVLTVYNDVHVDTMLVAGNTRGVTALDATTTTLAVDQPLYL